MIIPVMDLKNGEAVSGKSGMRNTYKPLKTVFSASSDPLRIADALNNAGYEKIYLADLDAIEGTGSNMELASNVNRIIPVMLDAGIKDSHEVENVLKYVDNAVVATETIESILELNNIFSSFDKNSLTLSVDVKDGQVLGNNIKTDFKTILKTVFGIEPKEIIILDISGVGTERGFDQELLKLFRDVDADIIVGGGVTPEDISKLGELGVEKFLVGTALHSGIIV